MQALYDPGVRYLSDPTCPSIILHLRERKLGARVD